MKKIINGKIYNTNTANLIASWSNHYYHGDFHQCSKNLYKTRKGSYFVHGEGGPLSEYAEPCGGSGYSSGEGWKSLTEEEALIWCEEHEISAEIIERYFKLEEA
jgi:hypothetical protein